VNSLGAPPPFGKTNAGGPIRVDRRIRSRQRFGFRHRRPSIFERTLQIRWENTLPWMMDLNRVGRIGRFRLDRALMKSGS
jgi:hypothetical protein